MFPAVARSSLPIRRPHILTQELEKGYAGIWKGERSIGIAGLLRGCDQGELAEGVSHPRCKNKGAPRVGHPGKKQPQILRLTTPNLYPTDEDLSVGTPELKSAWGPVRSQDDSYERDRWQRWRGSWLAGRGESPDRAKNIPQWLKPVVYSQLFAARLKPCPFKSPTFTTGC
jgi:hypothetical protein